MTLASGRQSRWPAQRRQIGQAGSPEQRREGPRAPAHSKHGWRVIHQGQHARGWEGSSRMTKTQTLFSNMHSCMIGGRSEAPGTQKGVWWVWKHHA